MKYKNKNILANSRVKTPLTKILLSLNINITQDLALIQHKNTDITSTFLNYQAYKDLQDQKT